MHRPQRYVTTCLLLTKDYERFMLMAEDTWTSDHFNLRFEINWPFYHVDQREIEKPRLTLGFEYLFEEVTLGLEYHFNGAGASDASAYLNTAQSDPLTRGEIYWLGQHYAGAFTSWQATDLVTLNLATLSNVIDSSANLVPSLVYNFSQGADVALGAYIGTGRHPRLVDDNGLPVLDPEVRSEFGAYGALVYVQLTGYL